MTDIAAVPTLTGVRRLVYVCLGFLFLDLAILGVFLPILPTTPFLLLASFFFARSSPRLHTWLLRSKTFGPLIRDWHERGGVRRSVKVTALTMIPLVIFISAYFGNLTWWLVIVLCVLGLIGMIVVIRLRVVEPEDMPKQSKGAD